MFSSFSIIFIIIIVHHFPIPFSNANPSGEDNMLIAVMKGHPKIQISEYSKQKYKTHLGIVHFMRTNWQCDKIHAKFDEYQRKECQKYRKYLDILHEYLYREYFAIPTVKPKFVFKKEFEIEGPIIYAVICLAKISQFYFNESTSNLYKYKFINLFINYFQIKLLNEERINYATDLENEPKMPINEMILQLAIDTANEWQTNESLDEIIRQNFEENLEEMYKIAEEKAKKEDYPWKAIKNDKHFIILDTKFGDERTWFGDALFSAFIKEYSNYLCRMEEKENSYWYDDIHMVTFGLCEIEKMKEYLTQKYEAHLGVMYLMRENWQCDKIRKELKENKLTECKKYRKYLDILYEYLFRLYAEAKNPKASKELPPVKPIFIIYYFLENLIRIISILNETSKCFWQKYENELMIAYDSDEINLVNEEELNYEMKKEKSGENASKNETETNIAEIRKEFEQKMKEMYENTEENVKDEKEKLEKAIQNKEGFYKLRLKEVYDEKFGTFILSPFS